MSILKNDRYYFICPFSPYLYSKRLSSKHCFFALVPFLKIVNHEIAIWQKIVQRKFVQLTLFCSEHFWQTNFKFKFSEICIIHIKWFWENLVTHKCSFYRALKHLNNNFAQTLTWKKIHSLQFFRKCVLCQNSLRQQRNEWSLAITILMHSICKKKKFSEFLIQFCYLHLFFESITLSRNQILKQI